jgi:hypothetical protein
LDDPEIGVLATWDIHSQKRPFANDGMAHATCRR